jgi:hypothetical protein
VNLPVQEEVGLQLPVGAGAVVQRLQLQRRMLLLVAPSAHLLFCHQCKKNNEISVPCETVLR